MSREALSKMSFEELLQRARAGEASAFDELFRRSKPTLDKWATRRRGWPPPGGARPSDISQDSSLLVLRGFSSFRGGTAGEWFGWLKKIFRNHLTQASRAAHSQKREAPGFVSIDSAEAAKTASRDRTPSQLTARREEWHRLFVCIHELPKDERTAIKLHHLKELSVAEIARHMERTESSVTGLLYRGWKRVQTRMNEEQDSGTGDLGEAAMAFMAYLRLRDSSEEVDLEAFIARHPTCADELRDMIHWIERLQTYRPSK
ncbi:sigma-70 family RNA polymerase sigma factor [Hyalangium rubrum]|uniref:Sigma-70 family RNA polymerase sigma factor n=1 Tax=Hyalangium rubrum TaxID=3103134 RepID=A0ABU5HAH7_9BACT|nr:sigma-70 family RNA polymerase sigma factor [Hyalangium sp. s54d21]MDY7230251.1 sigma-70 family RNA polymerase sigma factor [Hyalangium sp. s54d21]